MLFTNQNKRGAAIVTNGRRQHLLIKLGLLTEALLKLRDATAGVKNLLLACVERVACAANVGVNCAALLSAACCELIATTTCDLSFDVLRMDTRLHGYSLDSAYSGREAELLSREPNNPLIVPLLSDCHKRAYATPNCVTTNSLFP